tara:strand:- start:1419 stop:2522 length:1104 start_codon:yes stop_codon:yes gene_type:complete
MSINQNNQSNHLFFMRLAFSQANKNLGNTNENPSVGCVITKNNSVISSGYTGLNGRPHAEINAINFSKTSLKNSDLYVTLEPCSHYGKTPPCTRSIIKNKIKRVFFSILDPDLRSYNKSSNILKNKRISVYKGIYSNKISSFYRSYIKSKSNFLPFVTCKIAVSKDFFTINKKKEWITNKFSRGRVHLIRSNHDCIITSSKTIISDNSQLTCRINGLKYKSPSRIILDSKLKIPLNSKIIKEANNFRTIIFYNKFNKKKIKQLKDLNIQTFKIPLDAEKNLNLKIALIKAKQLGFYRIFLEAGKKMTISFFYKNLVDELKLFISNKNLGKNGISSIKKNLKLFLKNKNSHLERVNLFGDKLITYKIN